MLHYLPVTRQRLHATQRQLHAALDELRVAEAIFATTQPAMITDARRRILRVNEAFTELMGYTPEEVIGNTPWMFRSNHHDGQFYADMLATIGSTGRWQGEIWDRRKNGGVFPKWMSISAVHNAAGELTHLVATYTDLSAQKQAQQQIHQLAFYDRLTTLPNRTLLHERLQRAMADTGRSGRHGALLLLDWDDLKALNDSLGHPMGDALLQQIAQRLAACVQDHDTVGRLGGDEFAIVLPDVGSDREQAAARAESTAQAILRSLAQPMRLGNSDYAGSASLGLALFGAGATGATDADQLLKQAEMAMYQAKAAGRAGLHFFDAALEQAISGRLQLERELRAGIARQELLLHYQPQVALRDGSFRTIGAEALVRWQHPGRGLLGPGLFIPLAEETGLIAPLGQWVLQAACKQLGAWQRQPALAQLSLAVNVSAAQFLQPGFATDLLALLEQTGAPAQRLKLELTESMLLGNADTVVATMAQLQAHGVRFSLDDFGTGYSSLQYLKRLPLYQLKIDQGFVRDLEHNESDAAIARSVIALAQGLGLAVIAEGVESQAQQRLLLDMGCSNYQGYWFSRPLPLADFEAWCARSATVTPA
ncbi:MAG: EAL domain-containing protein [Proteobacteria bacterium]|nr:EAL domain-containing protein [Pseudomonadota bacterium]